MKSRVIYHFIFIFHREYKILDLKYDKINMRGREGEGAKGAACDGGAPSPLWSSLWADNNVVDGDVDKLDEETNEAHDGEADRRRDGNLLEFWKYQKKDTN